MRAGIAIARMITQTIECMEWPDDSPTRKQAVVKALLGVMELSVDDMLIDEVNACLEAINGRPVKVFIRETMILVEFRYRVQELEISLQNRKTALLSPWSRSRSF